jgi:LEA14-like dessication related protein
MTTALKRTLCLLIALLLTGCSVLKPSYETPQVTISSFRVLPSGSAAPQFEIGLHVINPNRIALELVGISYTISIDEHKLLSGVSNELPIIDAYGEGDVTVTAVPDLLGGIGLIADLMRVRRSVVNYNLQVKLDVGAILPAIHVEKTGEISLMGSNQW